MVDGGGRKKMTRAVGACKKKKGEANQQGNVSTLTLMSSP
jgi:hypothetical protein